LSIFNSNLLRNWFLEEVVFWKFKSRVLCRFNTIYFFSQLAPKLIQVNPRFIQQVIKLKGVPFMKLKLKSMPVMIAQIVASGALSVVAAHPAMAQQADESLQRITVTGSMVSRANKETPSPVQVLSADDLVKSGFTTVADVLQNLTSNGQGALAQGFAGAFAGGASGVALRGLSVGATLVLIDGHRMAPYPIGDDAQRQFVDVSSIPFDMVERIEVLKDGASSIYGSDAVAGVVNVILKKSIVGATVSAEMSTTQHGGGATRHATASGGFGDLMKDGYNIFGGIEVRHADAIKVSDRDSFLWANGDWTSRGGVNLNPGVPNVNNGGRVATNTPFFFNQTGTGGATNPANYAFASSACTYAAYSAGSCAVRNTASNLQPPTDNVNFMVGATKLLGDDWKMRLKASLFSSEDKNNRGLPATYPAGSFAGSTQLIPGQAPKIVNVIPSFLVPANYPGNTFGVPVRIYGYIADAPPTTGTDTTARAARMSADFDGTFMGWDMNVALGYSKVTLNIDYSGYVNRAALYAALIRPVNPFKILGGNTADDIATIFPLFSKESTSELKYGEVRGTRELMQLDGGQLAVSGGVSYVTKDISNPPAPLLANGTVGNGQAFAFGSEKNTAAFVEFVAPVLKNLEVDVSGRYDHFDTYGNSATPKLGFKFSPSNVITFRGTYAKGFRAPNAAETGTAGAIFSSGGVNDPILCADGNPKTKGNVIAACGFTPAYVQQTTKGLQPEKSTSGTLGLILEPVKGWSTTIDYYQVEITDKINTASLLPNFKPDFVRGDALPTAIADGNGGSFIGTPSVGLIAYATTGYVNVGSEKTSGIDLDTSYKFNFGQNGTLKAGLNWTHLLSYKLNFLSSTYELAGTHGPSGVSGDTGMPRDRIQVTFGYDNGPLNVTTNFNWTSSFSALDPSVGANSCASVSLDVAGRNYFGGQTVPAGFCTVASFLSTNLTATYKIGKAWTLHGGIMNVFDRQPPIDVATYGNAGNVLGYNATLHQAGVIGRAFSAGAVYRF
jgi:iron complex outermembrane receptor protein